MHRSAFVKVSLLYAAIKLFQEIQKQHWHNLLIYSSGIFEEVNYFTFTIR